jgi:hypothetical protein
MASRGEMAIQSLIGCRNVARSGSVVFASCAIINSASLKPCKGGDMVCTRSGSLGGTYVATLCNYGNQEGSIPGTGIDPSCDLGPKAQSLTNIENDLYQRKRAILIPRHSAEYVAVFDSST